MQPKKLLSNRLRLKGAGQLRYYEDRNFTERVLRAPVLSEDSYLDKPAPRPDDWSGQVRDTDDRLMPSDDNKGRMVNEAEGGVQQQRHPGLPEERVTKQPEPEQGDFFADAEEGSDPAADKHAMERLSNVTRAYGVNEGTGPEKDILPGF